jgi:exonuclease III
MVLADIVCLQETKLRRCDIGFDLAVVDGWQVAAAADAMPQ